MFASSFASILARVRQKLTKCLNKHLVMTLWVRRKPMTGLTGLKMAERDLTMTKVLDDLQPAQRRKMLQKCVRLFARTVGEQSMTFATFWDCHTEHASAFCWMNSTCGLLKNSC
jgi:hypothetical protein